MPHQNLRLRPGVDVNDTIALNEAGISVSQLIRFFYDPVAGALPQKLGGWTKFYLNQTVAAVRALWAWESTQSQAFLAVGTEDQTDIFQAQLGVINNGSLDDITPKYVTNNTAPVASTTMGDSIVIITDATVTNLTLYDTVYIPAHISVGGLILFGLYQCDPDNYIDVTTYTIRAVDSLGAPLPAPSTSTSPTVASFTTVSGSGTVTVTLADHGYSIGDTYPICVETVAGGITLFGHYIVQAVASTSQFDISGSTNATSSTTTFINDGKARYIYGFGVGSIPGGTGYGIGTYGSGGYGTGTAVPPVSQGSPIAAQDWTLDNWGEVLIACAIADPIILTTVSASGTGSTGTVVFSETYTIPIGETVTVAGVVPTTWNGTYIVTGSTANSVSFGTVVTSAITTNGTVTVDSSPYQPVYAWDAESGAPTASVLPAAPPVNDGVFVAMPQRQIVAWGSTFTGIADPLLLRWCDVNNFNVWLGTVTNQAGSFRIPRGSRIVGCIQGPQQGLVWTDVGLWSMQYIGPPLVYSFNEIGTGCGLIARKAAAAINGEIYWMGPRQFFSLTGDGVAPLPCAVWDVVYQNLDTDNLPKIRTAVNSRFGEIAWYYPSAGGTGEVDSYVKFNVTLGTWDYGTLSRSAWVDQSVLGAPIGADPDTLYIYQHETSPDADGAALVSNFRTGWFAMAEGDDKTFVDQVWPDFKYGEYGGTPSATVNITFYTADYPWDTPTVFGPYPITSSSTFLSPRIRARLISIEIGSVDIGSFWRLGLVRYRLQPDGRF